jgi:hypothetical protein
MYGNSLPSPPLIMSLAIGHNPQSIYETTKHSSDTTSDGNCYVQQKSPIYSS